MAKAVMCHDNRVRVASVNASSERTTTPASQLLREDLGLTWQSNDVNPAGVWASLPSPEIIDVVALLNFWGDAGATFRIRASFFDDTGVTGDALDTGSIGGFDPVYRHFIYVLPSPVIAWGVRIDITQPGAEYVEAGGLLVGRLWRFASNFEHGFRWGTETGDQRTVSRGGDDYILEGYKRRTFQCRFPNITPEDLDARQGDLQQRVGIARPVLLITDPAAAQLGRVSIYGRLRNNPEFPEVSHRRYAWDVTIGELTNAG